MKIHVYRTSRAHRDYCGRSAVGTYMESLKELERRGLPTIESFGAFQSMFIATKEFLAREVRSQFPEVLRQGIPCFPGSSIVFCEPEDPEGWASIYIASRVRLGHLESAYFAVLEVFECGRVEVSHSDGRSRPSFDTPPIAPVVISAVPLRPQRRFSNRSLL